MIIIKNIMDNKICSGIAVALFGLLMAWGIWMTNGNYKIERTQDAIENVRSDVDELKKDTKEIRVELKDQREVIYKNQEKIIERLGSMGRMQESIHKSVEGRNFSSLLKGKELPKDK